MNKILRTSQNTKPITPTRVIKLNISFAGCLETKIYTFYKADVQDSKANTSFAYQIGMMVVSKAAEVVHTVAEGGDGKKHQQDIENVEVMREKLERATSRGEELFLELENAKVCKIWV